MVGEIGIRGWMGWTSQRGWMGRIGWMGRMGRMMDGLPLLEVRLDRSVGNNLTIEMRLLNDENVDGWIRSEHDGDGK